MRITPAVKYLIIANVIMFILTYIAENVYHFDLISLLGLWYFGVSNFQLYQIITSIFMHGGLAHIAFNMFSLASVGGLLEQTWGSKRFFNFFILSGIGANLFYLAVQGIRVYSALGHFMVSSDEINSVGNIVGSPAVGASGAIYGLITAIAMLYPNIEFNIMFIPVPIKAKYLIVGFVIFDLIFGIANLPSDHLAHFAHIGGAITGYILVKFFYGQNNKFRHN